MEYPSSLTPHLDPRPIATGIMLYKGEEVPWAYMCGQHDDPDTILFRHRECPLRLTVPPGQPWPRTAMEASAVALRVILHGYLKMAHKEATPTPEGQGTLGGEPVGPAHYEARASDF